MVNRKEMLTNFLENEKYRDYSGLSDKELKEVSFNNDGGSKLTAALTKMIFSYDAGDADATILKKTLAAINQ